MPFAYVIIDGKRVNKGFADDYYRLEAAFRNAFGLDLIISDGVRTYEEQKRGYADFINGRTSVRWANPDSLQAYHVETNPSGPRAIDIRDSGSDAGVTRYGNARSQWINNNAEKYNWKPRGYREFNEPWHLENTGTPLLEGQATWNPNDKLNEDGQLGPQTISKLQSVLGVNPDGQLGPISIKALQARVGSNQDGQLGPDTISKMQSRIGADADGKWGNNTTLALQRHLNSGGTLSVAVVIPNPVVDKIAEDGELGPDTIKKWQSRVGATVDGELGPETIRKTQEKIGARVDGALGPQTIKGIQLNVGANPDGQMGPETIKKLQIFLNAGLPFQAVITEPEVPVDLDPADELEATPNMVTPKASDFPAWIRFETKIDPDANNPTLNIAAKKYYGKPYQPIESHTHWWNEPGKGGTHDANVNSFLNGDLSVNFVVSERRITLMVPLNKIAITTGQRNPYAWKSENDPTLSDWQYKTMGYLHYIVEKLNPSLKGEAIRLHKEFMATRCSDIDVSLVRKYADMFANGDLDIATGNLVAPKPTPEPTPDPTPGDGGNNVKMICLPETLVKGLAGEFRELADEFDKYVK